MIQRLKLQMHQKTLRLMPPKGIPIASAFCGVIIKTIVTNKRTIRHVEKNLKITDVCMLLEGNMCGGYK